MSPGRPPKPVERRRTVRKGIAFTTDEYDRLCRTAITMRMDVNAFIRLMCLPESVTVLAPNYGCPENTNIH